MKCLGCGNTLKKGKGNYKYTQSGLDNITLAGIPNHTCPSCKEQDWEVPCSEELHLMIGFMLALKPKNLTGKEARFLRKNLGYTADELASVMGVQRITVTKWENEKTKFTGSNDKHIRRIYLGKKKDVISRTPEIMRILINLIDFISLDDSPANKEVKIREEDWMACEASIEND